METPKDTFNINDLNSAVFKAGDVFSYTYRKHTSVGISAYYEVDKEGVVELLENRVEYLHPERMKQEGICGADNARGAFVFKATSGGHCVITFFHDFRGDVERTHKVEICVE